MLKTLMPHQLRVLAEREELGRSAEKMGMFLRSTLATTVENRELSLLARQLAVMRELMVILDLRIALFGGGVSQ